MARNDVQKSRQKEAALPLVSAPVAAAVLGISRRQFDRLVDRKVFVRAAAGERRFRLHDVVRAYVAYVQHGKEASSEIAQARLAYLNTQREAVEQRTRERARELLERGDVARVFDASMVQIAAALDGLPGRMAGSLAAVNEPARIQELLADEVRRVRETAAADLAALASCVERGGAAEAAAATHGRSLG
jgi:hypothetical protein